MTAKQPAVHDHTYHERCNVLAPPTFEPTGETKTFKQAIEDGNWTGSINIWLYTRTPEPSIIYQIRSPLALWAPGKLDVAAAGFYSVGQSGLDGLKELKEELGVTLPKGAAQFFTRKLAVTQTVKGQERKSCISVYIAEYTGTLEDMAPQEYEVYGVVRVPIAPLMGIFDGSRESLEVPGIDAHKQPLSYVVTADSFPYNFDDYQRKMAEYIALKLGVDDAYLGN